RILGRPEPYMAHSVSGFSTTAATRGGCRRLNGTPRLCPTPLVRAAGVARRACFAEKGGQSRLGCPLHDRAACAAVSGAVRSLLSAPVCHPRQCRCDTSKAKINSTNVRVLR